MGALSGGDAGFAEVLARQTAHQRTDSHKVNVGTLAAIALLIAHRRYWTSKARTLDGRLV